MLNRLCYVIKCKIAVIVSLGTPCMQELKDLVKNIFKKDYENCSFQI